MTGGPPADLHAHTATLLPSGQVLLAGGFQADHAPSASTFLYDPDAGAWRATGSLSTPRAEHTATLLPSGQVLIAGGFSSSALAAAEVYDAATNTWNATRSLAVARAGHTATLLPSGKVLVAGGVDPSGLSSRSAELYDPATGEWQQAADMLLHRRGHSATLLPSGLVLVAGGFSDTDSPYVLNSAELFDPGQGGWSDAGALSSPRFGHSAVLLATGEVLAAGGVTGNALVFLRVATAELYAPSARLWSAAGQLAPPRSSFPLAVLTAGSILALGGAYGKYGELATAMVEAFDPAVRTWTALPSLAAPRAFHTATVLPSGRVLVVGGARIGEAPFELYDFVPVPRPLNAYEEKPNGDWLRTQLPTNGELRGKPRRERADTQN